MRTLALIVAVTGALSLNAPAGEFVKRNVYYYSSDKSKTHYVYQSDRNSRSSRRTYYRPVRSDSRRYYPVRSYASSYPVRVYSVRPSYSYSRSYGSRCYGSRSVGVRRGYSTSHRRCR